MAEAALGRGIGLAGERVGDQVARARWEAAAEVGDGEDLRDVAGQFGVEVVEVRHDQGLVERVRAGREDAAADGAAPLLLGGGEVAGGEGGVGRGEGVEAALGVGGAAGLAAAVGQGALHALEAEGVFGGVGGFEGAGVLFEVVALGLFVGGGEGFGFGGAEGAGVGDGEAAEAGAGVGAEEEGEGARWGTGSLAMTGW